jgi:hypothetical protein
MLANIKATTPSTSTAIKALIRIGLVFRPSPPSALVSLFPSKTTSFPSKTHQLQMLSKLSVPCKSRFIYTFPHGNRRNKVFLNSFSSVVVAGVSSMRTVSIVPRLVPSETVYVLLDDFENGSWPLLPTIGAPILPRMPGRGGRGWPQRAPS